MRRGLSCKEVEVVGVGVKSGYEEKRKKVGGVRSEVGVREGWEERKKEVVEE